MTSKEGLGFVYNDSSVSCPVCLLFSNVAAVLDLKNNLVYLRCQN